MSVGNNKDIGFITMKTCIFLHDFMSFVKIGIENYILSIRCNYIIE